MAIKHQNCSKHNMRKAKKETGVWSLLEAKALGISAVCAEIYFCYPSIISFLTPYANEIHLQTAAAFFFIVYSIAILITRPFTGRLFDQRGAKITMLPAFLSFFVGMIQLCKFNFLYFLGYWNRSETILFRIFSFTSWISRNVPCNGRNDHFIYDILFALLLNFILT